MSLGEPVNPPRTTQGTSTNPEPSPDDDVIVVTSVASYCRIGTRWWRVGPYGKDAGPYAWADIAGDPSARIYVRASRLAVVEAELAEAQRDDLLAENEQQLQEITDLAEQLDAARATLDRLGHAVTEAGSARAAQLAVLAILNPPEETS